MELFTIVEVTVVVTDVTEAFVVVVAWAKLPLTASAKMPKKIKQSFIFLLFLFTIYFCSEEMEWKLLTDCS